MVRIFSKHEELIKTSLNHVDLTGVIFTVKNRLYIFLTKFLVFSKGFDL